MSRTGEYVLALALGAAGAGLAVLATTGGRSWRTVTVRADGLPPQTFVSSAQSGLEWATAAALVALACVGAVLATRGTGRRVVGALQLLAGAAVVTAAVVAGGTLDDDLRDEVAASAAGSDQEALAAALDDPSAQAWRWAALVGGLGAAAAGGLTLVRGPRWPAMGSRYEKTGTTGAAAPVTAEAPATDVWRAQDHGHDPTA